MPRNRPVDYPSVHPPTAQPQLGLAPPQNTQPRFSWQVESTDSLSGNAEQRLEAGTAAERRQSRIPPLPVLPEHLASDAHQQSNTDTTSTQVVLPSLRATQFQVQPQDQQVSLQQPSHFRPDIPRHFQEQQPQGQTVPSHAQPQRPIPSYEASQAAYQHPQLQQTRMQEQALYPGPDNRSHAQLSAHALPMHDDHQSQAVEHQSSEEKPEEKLEQRVRQPPQPQQTRVVQVGPDANPLSPASPTSAVSPSQTTNIQAFPPPSGEMQFPRTPTYAPVQSERGGTWHHGLGSCAEPTTCLPSMFCPCIVYGRTQHRLSLKSAKKDTTNMLGYSSINGSCLAWSILPGINILLTAIQHTRLRKSYEMDSQAGNLASDCLKSTCCCCCVIAQDEKEMKLREEVTRKGEINQGYKSPGEMTFAPPP